MPPKEILLYGQLFENFPTESNAFQQKPFSIQYERFYRRIFLLIKEIVYKDATYKQKELLDLFLQGNRLYDLSVLMQINNSTVHQNYNALVKRISIGLASDPKFENLVLHGPEPLREKLLQWIDETRKLYLKDKFVCPICSIVFTDRPKLKKHIIKNQEKRHLDYHHKQIIFIDQQLKKYGFKVEWIYRHKDYLLFSMSWIWNRYKLMIKKKKKKNKRTKYAKISKRSLFQIFKDRFI